MRSEKRHSVHPELYDEAYFLGSCEGYAEFIATEGAHLSNRLSQAFEAAQIAPGMRVLDVGCGRGEILHHCARLGAQAHGVDYAPIAAHIARRLAMRNQGNGDAYSVHLADAKCLPFRNASFDRVLMFDLVEHLHPWELDRALAEARRVLRPDGRLIIHTAPNVWYDRYAYPMVRFVRTLMGQGDSYPKDPRALVQANLDVHVNEQSMVSLRRVLRQAGFHARVWLHTPPQNRREGWIFRTARHILFNFSPFRWFFEREVFAVATVDNAG